MHVMACTGAPAFLQMVRRMASTSTRNYMQQHQLFQVIDFVSCIATVGMHACM